MCNGSFNLRGETRKKKQSNLLHPYKNKRNKKIKMFSFFSFFLKHAVNARLYILCKLLVN